MPRGSDWVNEFVVDRVIGVEPTPSAPRGALRFFARDARNSDGSGFRCISFDEITEVIGTIGGQLPRKTQRELRQEVRAEKRAERRVRRKGELGRGGRRELPAAPEPEPEAEVVPARKRRRRITAESGGSKPTGRNTEPEEVEIQTLSSRRKGRSGKRRRRGS